MRGFPQKAHSDMRVLLIWQGATHPYIYWVDLANHEITRHHLSGSFSVDQFIGQDLGAANFGGPAQ
jgi:hypothetical protein